LFISSPNVNGFYRFDVNVTAKKFENRSIVDEDMDKSLRLTFCATL